MRCILPLLVSLVLVAGSGCAHAPPPLDVRVDPTAVGLDARRSAAVRAYNELADRLQALASYYDRQVRVNHGKLRGMSVLSAISAGVAAGLVPAAVHPRMPEDGRRLLATFSVTLAANGIVFGLVPHAHQYFLKEVGYQRQARAARDGYRAVVADCGPTLLADPEAPHEHLEACIAAARTALDAGYTFEPDSPCKPPTDSDLDTVLSAGRKAR